MKDSTQGMSNGVRAAAPPPTAPLRRPAELDQLDLGRSAVIEASAGTGKTYLLEHLVLDLLISGRARLDEILVVTFTERATAELVGRIRKKIDQALATSDAPEVTGWTIDDRARARLTEARQSFDQATIATIHSFCQRVLTDEPLATRRLLAQSQVDGRQAFGEIFRDVLRRTLTTDDKHRGYLDAYLATGRNVDRLEALLFAAATARGQWAAVYDEPSLAAAAEGLATLKLEALELEKLLRKILHHSKVAAMLRRLRRLVPLARDILPARAWGRFLAGLDDEADLFPYLEALAAEQSVPALVDPLWRVARLFMDAAPSLDEAIAQRFVPIVDAELRQRKLAEGLYDYDDMIRAVDDALAGAEGPDLIDRLRRRYRYALVDEAQDTEPAQWRIFRRLFLDSTHPNPVVLIGDPKQAIYGFRGADVHTYVEAREDIRARAGTVLPLRRNYRSDPEVIAACNAILDHTASPPYFTDESIAYDNPVVPFHPSSGDGPGVTLLRVEPPAGGTAPMRIGPLKKALRDAIADRIVRLRSAASDGGLSRIYVVTRSNAEATEIAARLHEAGVPNLSFKPDYLFRSPEATHVRALLLAIADPTDRAARLRAWLTPFFDVELDALAAAGDPPAAHPLMARLHAWKALGDARAYDDLWARVLDDSGITRRLRLSPSGLRRLTNYRHLFDVLHAEAAASPCQVADLAATLATFAAGNRRPAGDADTQRLETDADAVRIMTIHAAKGLEAEHVFVYGGFTAPRRWGGIHTFHRGTVRLLCAGKPRRTASIERIDAARHEEDQRLLYVAMTRARKHLYLPFFPNIEPGESDFKSDEGGDFDVFKKVSGPYRHVNQRLRALDADAGRRALFGVQSVPTTELPRAGDGAAPALLAHFAPSPADGATTTSRDADATAVLRARRRGFTITSYTHMKEAEAERSQAVGDSAVGDGAVGDGAIDDSAVPADDAAPIVDPIEALDMATVLDAGGAPPDALPGGAASGLFLHGVLEKVDLGTLPPLAIWQKQPEVRRLIETELRRWDREPRHFDAAARLVHAALTAPIAMPDGSRLPGISRAARVRREVDFLFPLRPTTPLSRPDHQRGQDDDRLVAMEIHDSGIDGAGFVRGYFDVIFEHEGRVAFADWKSNVLPRYDGASLGAHVESDYGLQVRLYTLALVRMLGIREQADYERLFGGVVYLYLRGLDHTTGRGADDGVYVCRPAYDQVLLWQNDLMAGAS